MIFKMTDFTDDFRFRELLLGSLSISPVGLLSSFLDWHDDSAPCALAGCLAKRGERKKRSTFDDLSGLTFAFAESLYANISSFS